MAWRPLGIKFPDARYHVMNRGRCGENVFGSRDDYERFITLFQNTVTLENHSLA